MPPRWTFVTAHASTLMHIAHDPCNTIRVLAQRIHLTERSIHRIIRDLERDGYIRKTKLGRRNCYEVVAQHQVHGNAPAATVGDLVQLLGAPQQR